MEEFCGIIFFLEIINNLFEKKIKSKILKYIKGIAIVSISVQIVIMPIMVYSYKTISLTFFVANILTSFLITLIIILGFAIVLISLPLLGLTKILGQAYKVLIFLLLNITEFTSKIPFSKIYVKTPYIHEIILYYICVFGMRIFNEN